MRVLLAMSLLLWPVPPLQAAELPWPANQSDFAEPAQAPAGAQRCMTEAIYYEAALEPDAGQEAVAQVVLNRLHDPHFPKTVCGVVYQGSRRATGCQFTFTCDGSLSRAPAITLWRRADAVSARALEGTLVTPIGNATFYHADYVAPTWSRRMDRVGQIGRHIFYRRLGQAGGTIRATPVKTAGPAVLQAWGLTVVYVGQGGLPRSSKDATSAPLQPVRFASNEHVIPGTMTP